jgi:hypothetical protein
VDGLLTLNELPPIGSLPEPAKFVEVNCQIVTVTLTLDDPRRGPRAGE